MTLKLSPTSLATVRTVVNFSKLFNADVATVTPTKTAAIDDVPTLFILFDGHSFDGPDIVVTRIRDLANRIKADDTSITVVLGGAESKPKSLQIKSGKSTFDFRLASGTHGDRIPAKFNGTFVHELKFPRADLTEAIAGAQAIGSKILTFVQEKNNLQLMAGAESENFVFDLGDLGLTSEFQYNYSVEYLNAIDKLLPKTDKEVTFNVTPRGHMRIKLATDNPQITASVFLLDIKDR